MAWINDGSAEIATSGNEVSCTNSSPTGNVFNALWEDTPGSSGVKDGQHYWKLDVKALDSSSMSLFVGVTDKAKFKQGWAIKGLLYGGNLSNGSSLLVGEFGPSLKSGNQVGIFVSFEGDQLKVYLDLNGNPLGLAFDLPKTIFDGIFPVAHFSGPGAVAIQKVSGAPSSLVRPAPVHVGIEGDWRLVATEFKINGAVTPTPVNVTMRLTKTSGNDAATESYSVGVHVVNRIGFSLSRTTDSGVWTASPGMSTLMGGSPECMALEGQINQLTSSPGKVELDGEILVWNNTVANMDSKWERYAIVKEPVTQNPFQ